MLVHQVLKKVTIHSGHIKQGQAGVVVSAVVHIPYRLMHLTALQEVLGRQGANEAHTRLGRVKVLSISLELCNFDLSECSRNT